MTTGIYKITNLINNKIYIGQSIHIERRWTEHCRPSASSLISNAIKKYGSNNFSFEIIEICNKEILNEREAYWIQFYNSLKPNGYNIEDNTESNHSLYVHFTKEELYDIINDLTTTTLSLSEIANKYHLNVSTISRINNGSIHHLDQLIYPLRDTNYNKVTKYYFCIDCGKQISPKAIRCNICEGKNRQTQLPIDRNELKQLIRTTSFTSIGKQFNVSDNAVRKWCDKYNLPRKVSEIKKYNDEEWRNI